MRIRSKLLLPLLLAIQAAAGPPDSKAESATTKADKIARYVEARQKEEARIAELVQKSELICVAKVTMSGLSASHGDAGMTIELSVEKVLKGDKRQEGAKIEAAYGGTYIADPDDPVRAEAPLGRMVVFLKPFEFQTAFVVSDSYFGVLPYSSTVVVAVRLLEAAAERERGAKQGEQAAPSDGEKPSN
jgi:hypothetical protein